MRKLASIQRIAEILPHTNADSLEIAKVLGWQCIVKKGEYKPGDWTIFCEIDSVLPDGPSWSEFMRRVRFRVRTAKFRGELSQGLCLPLSVLPPQGIATKPDGTTDINYTIAEGQEVTDLLGIVKYEPTMPASLGGDAKGLFPSFIPKTDETRVQGLSRVLARHAGVRCYVTEKLEGSSMTSYINEDVFGVCSRNLDLKETEGNAFWIAARKLDLEAKLRSVGKNIAVQGEILGPGLNGNIYGFRDFTVRFFNVYDIDSRRYYDFEDFINFYKDLQLETVPVLDTDHVIVPDIQFYIKDADGLRSTLADCLAEGKVYRPLVETIDPDLGRLSMKAINNTYLIEQK